jgi:hypothetical protein
VITRALLFVKHRLPWLWALVEWLNGKLFRLLHEKELRRQAQQAFAEFELQGYVFRPLEADDLGALENLLERQGADRLRYFQPHGFDRGSLQAALGNPAFLMFGAFSGQTLAGYFFLRCFWNRRCFVGRLIDQPHERRGVGRVMNRIMYHTAWRSGFRCMTTISKYNRAIIRSHANNPSARLVGELANDYLLVEFLPEGSFDAHERVGV